MSTLRRRIMVLGEGDSGDYVDLGLPSGVKWCNHNIGGTNPEDYGYYFSWGNVEGHVKGSGYNFNSSTYNSTPGHSLTGNIAVGDTYDIARNVMGSPWRLPTKDEFKELYNNTDSEWVSNYNNTGVAGRKFMKKSDHSVYIFFPACGSCSDTSLYSEGTGGDYWSSTYYSSSYAYHLDFGSSYVSPEYSGYRYYGFSGRAVCNPMFSITITLTGDSVSGITVTVTDSDGISHSGTTDSNGVVRLTGVASGSAKVSASEYILSPFTINVNSSSRAFTIGCESAVVDLGLPSGLLWAKGNITKDTNENYYIAEPTEYGAYFSWGNIDGHRVAGQSDSYNFNSNNYNSTAGKGLTSDIPANATYDAARARLGGNWRIPTEAECQELLTNCTWNWKASGNTDYNGVAGYEVVGPNGRKMFLPCTGYYYQNTYANPGEYGFVWSTKYKDTTNAYYLYYVNNDIATSSYYRWVGRCIRAVRNTVAVYYSITITFVSTDSSSISGLSVTVTDSEGTMHTGTTNAQGQISLSGVAEGIASVSVSGRILSANSITVSSSSRSFIINCAQQVSLGIYAYYSDGTMKSYADADTYAIGVAVITNNCSFVIDKSTSLKSIKFGGYNKYLSGIGVVLTSSQANALLDYDGEGNTTKIITALSGYNDGYSTGAPAAEYCRAAFNGQGYLPSLGEWNEAYANKSAIDSMMTKIGGTPIPPLTHWASTLYDASTYSWGLNWYNGDANRDVRGNSNQVRAFRALYSF